MMATADRPRSPSRAARTGRRRNGIFLWTADQVYQLYELGFFGDRRVELLDGVLYEMTVNPPHAQAILRATRYFLFRFREAHSVRFQLPLDLGRRSLPEPDVALVVGTDDDYRIAHPKAAVLVIEISDATLRKDRTIKAHLYAHAGIADYWILNLVDRQLEIHRNPGPDPSRKGRFRYADVTIVPADGHASPLVAPEANIAVADLLP
jgi:Uma2 family endonuclease